ncbi:MAG: anthranilate phosphoribosyltransferase [Bryobacterales bacterium]|nr:anthranilate phosphoribosyltransferase [Bryobacterales bacterium]
MPLLAFLHKAASGETLSREEAFAAMESILSGEASPPLIAAFLVALRTRGENATELAGFAASLRQHAIPVPLATVDRPLLDTCGTGGDGAQTFNISTVAAFVAAGAGVHVAKHGNRSVSSRCGSADVLEQLGIPLLHSPEVAARAIEQVGIAFLFAPSFHPAVRHAMPVRKELRMRTVFNLLGPLVNPANASCQLVGAPGVKEARMMATALSEMGAGRSYIVHGSDGLDEITTTGPTLVLEAEKGAIREWQFHPDMLGVPLAQPSDLRGGDAEENAAITMEVLSRASGPKRDIVLVNSAFAISAAHPDLPLSATFAMAVESVDSGNALGKLNALREFMQAAEN